MSHEVEIRVPREDADLLEHLLKQVTVDHAIAISTDAEVTMGRTLHSLPPELPLVTVGAATSTTIHALGAVLGEYIRSRKKKVRVQLSEHNTIELEGDFSPAQIASLIDAGRSNGLSPPEQD